jgi:hypothetical protein
MGFITRRRQLFTLYLTQQLSEHSRMSEFKHVKLHSKTALHSRLFRLPANV